MKKVNPLMSHITKKQINRDNAEADSPEPSYRGVFNIPCYFLRWRQEFFCIVTPSYLANSIYNHRKDFLIGNDQHSSWR